MPKICRWDRLRCYLSSCDSLDSCGFVVLCRRHLNRYGLHTFRNVKRDLKRSFAR